MLADTTDPNYLVRRSIEELQVATEQGVGGQNLLHDRLLGVERAITLLLLAVANAKNCQDTGDGGLSGQRPSGKENPG